jgi:glycosyltransferase involved in cell wall biosynthesis
MSMPRRRKILVFDPYLDTLGGGERYIFALAHALASDADVTLAGPVVPPAGRLDHLGFATSVPVIQIAKHDFPRASADYDMAVVLTNDVPPPSNARINWAVVQFPFEPLADRSHFRDRFRQWRNLRQYRCIVYSQFCEDWLWRRWHRRSVVVAPPVETREYVPADKKPMILSVGRFFTGGHCKRQDLLVQAFKQLAPRIAPEWRLVLAGGAKDDASTREYLHGIEQAIGDSPISVRVNISQDELASLYRHASLFWHATGFGRDAANPESAEHFGMTTVEAMSAGAVPLVYADGGQREIVTSEVGCLWQEVDELVEASAYLTSDDVRRQTYAQAGVRAAAAYQFPRFNAMVRALLQPGVTVPIASRAN